MKHLEDSGYHSWNNIGRRKNDFPRLNITLESNGLLILETTGRTSMWKVELPDEIL